MNLQSFKTGLRFIQTFLKFFFGDGIRDNARAASHKNFSILFVIITLFFIVDILQSYGLDLGKDSYIEYNIKDSLEIIFITLATFFILKYKYHIHHFISLAIFTLLTVIIDLILKYYQKINITSIILSFLYILIESVYYTYLKYLVENKYYYTFDIIGIFGAFNILLVIVSFSIEVIIHKVKGTNRLIFYFYFFYKEYQTWNMILRFIIGFIFEGFFLGTLEVLILKEFTPNYVIIAYSLGRIPLYMMGRDGSNRIDDKKRWIIFAIFLIQIFILLFYLEILEFNFCSLNKNTGKNIKDRERSQTQISNDDNDNFSVHELSEGYYISKDLDEKRDSRISRVSRVSRESEMIYLSY